MLQAIGMKHTDFQIGRDFWCSERQWRCTDIGTRVIVAISLEARELEELNVNERGEWESHRRRSEDQDWLQGPPYAVAEVVFDENDLAGCEIREANA